jgi:hypothetical protein
MADRTVAAAPTEAEMNGIRMPSPPGPAGGWGRWVSEVTAPTGIRRVEAATIRREG